MTIESVLHYRILRRLGVGGMGEVYLAEDLKLGRKTAIKFLRDDSLENDLARKRLMQEARAAAALDHPNICTIHEVHDEGERPFIVMQYVEGENLATIIKNHPPKPAEVVDLAIQMTEALVDAHAHGIIHRDIKPQNVMVTARGQVKILDFGLAKLLPQPASLETEAETLSVLTEIGQVLGTVGYMSPEQLRGGPVDARTDLFSLGVLLYNCATGRSPFTGTNSLDICLKILQSDPPKPCDLNAEVPPELERIILKAMAKDVKTRYGSAGEMLTDLHSLKAIWQEESPVRTLPVADEPTRLQSPAVTLSDRLRRKPVLIAVAVIAILLTLTVWLTLTLRRGASHQPTPAARGWYDKGTTAIGEGAYYQATKALLHAVELDPNYALAHARLAEAYMEMDASEQAKEELLTAVDLASDRSVIAELDALYLDGVAATVRRDFLKAIKSYQEIVERAPAAQKASAYMDLGRSYEKNEKIDEAIGYYQEAANRDTESAGAFLRLAILYGRKQDLEKAKEAFANAEKIYRDSSNAEGVAEVFFQRGTMLNKINKVQEARRELEQALDLARQEGNIYQQVRAKLQLSTVYIEENTGRARDTADEAIKLAQANNLRGLAGNGLIDLGYTFVYRGDYEQGSRYFTQALEIARKDKALKTEARALLALGSVEVNQAQPDEGIAHLKQALAFYEPASYRKETSIALTMLGRAQRTLGNYDEAIKIFTQQLKVCEELGDSALVADANLSLALTLGVEQERYPEALPYIEASYRINTASDSPMNAGYDEMNRAAILWQLGRYMEARQSLDQARLIANRPQAEYKALQAWLLLISAQMALSERDLATARKKGQETLNVAGAQYRDVMIQAKVCLGLAEALSGAPQLASQPCQEALAAAREIKNPRLVASVLLALAEVMVLTKDATGALRAAAEAQESFARSGRQDSQWRALLVAARASELTGNREQASEYAARADGLLSTLEQKWGAEAFNGYIRRPDIQAYRKQLTQLLSLKN